MYLAQNYPQIYVFILGYATSYIVSYATLFYILFACKLYFCYLCAQLRGATPLLRCCVGWWWHNGCNCWIVNEYSAMPRRGEG